MRQRLDWGAEFLIIRLEDLIERLVEQRGVSCWQIFCDAFPYTVDDMYGCFFFGVERRMDKDGVKPKPECCADGQYTNEDVRDDIFLTDHKRGFLNLQTPGAFNDPLIIIALNLRFKQNWCKLKILIQLRKNNILQNYLVGYNTPSSLIKRIPRG